MGAVASFGAGASAVLDGESPLQAQQRGFRSNCSWIRWVRLVMAPHRYPRFLKGFGSCTGCARTVSTHAPATLITSGVIYIFLGLSAPPCARVKTGILGAGRDPPQAVRIRVESLASLRSA